MDAATAIAALLGIILLGLKQWQSGQQKRDQEKRNEEIQQGRADLESGNVDAVERRIDGLLSDGQSDSAAGQPSAEDVERRIGKL